MGQLHVDSGWTIYQVLSPRGGHPADIRVKSTWCSARSAPVKNDSAEFEIVLLMGHRLIIHPRVVLKAIGQVPQFGKNGGPTPSPL
jgi:hypothetical protein